MVAYDIANVKEPVRTWYTALKVHIPDRWVKLALEIRVIPDFNHVSLAGVNNRVRIKKKLPKA